MGSWRRERCLFIAGEIFIGRGCYVLLCLITASSSSIKACLQRSYLVCWLFSLHIKNNPAKASVSCCNQVLTLKHHCQLPTERGFWGLLFNLLTLQMWELRPKREEVETSSQSWVKLQLRPEPRDPDFSVRVPFAKQSCHQANAPECGFLVWEVGRTQ